MENRVQVLVETLEGKDVKDDEIVKSMQDIFSEGRVLDFHEDTDMDGPVTYLMVDRGNVFQPIMDQWNFVLESPFLTLQI